MASPESPLNEPLALTVFDAEHSSNEERWFTLGTSRDGKLLALAHTFEASGPNSNSCHFWALR